MSSAMTMLFMGGIFKTEIVMPAWLGIEGLSGDPGKLKFGFCKHHPLHDRQHQELLRPVH